MADRLRVAVVGAGSWAQRAHIPGWQRDPRAEVVALADANAAVAADAASRFGVPTVTTDYTELLGDPGIDVIDVVTGNQPHFQISWDALSAGKHVLCEKPVHASYRKTHEAAEFARSKGLKTKLGLHLPVRAGDPVRQGADRLGLRRRAVRLQRLRAEQPVDRPGDPAAPGRSRGRSGPDCRVIDRGLRRADHRHHALVAGRAADSRSWAPCATSCRAGCCATPAS